MVKVAKIAVDNTALYFDKLFEYSVPENMAESAKVGSRVIIPFGKGNKNRQGMIYELSDSSEMDKIKPILGIIDETPVFTDDMFEMANYLVNNTFCTNYEAIKTILPKGLNINIKPVYSLSIPFSKIDIDSFEEEEKNLLGFLRISHTDIEIDNFLDIKINPKKKKIVMSLMDKGIIKLNDRIKQEVTGNMVRMIELCGDADMNTCKLSQKQKELVNFLEQNYTASVKEVCYLCGITEAVIKALEKKNIVRYYQREEYRLPYKSDKIIESVEEITLSKEQQDVFNGLIKQCNSDDASVALLHGITGSGKTQIFIKLINEIISDGRQVIMLVPEISLTPQMVNKFINIFGKKVAVIHSNLSLGERLDEWKRIKSGEADIVVGTRSAIFSPLNNIGLIIMDEEGEGTYKSEASPRYHARNVAKFRCFRHKAMLLLASATPSVDSYYNAQAGKYTIYKLKNRYSNSVLPEVYIIDLRKEHMQTGGDIIISESLGNEIKENMRRGEQSILLLNRRGYNTFATCLDCEKSITCPNCSVSLVYHKTNNSLMCHYCGYSYKYDNKCNICGNEHIHLSGLGTQKIEDELNKCFPEARILRMDTDTTYSRHIYEKKFGQFENGEYDILIGTQMIAKGLDFHNVTLVGVLSADHSLYTGDFKSAEKTFSLITQVVGRCGRGEKPGRAYIQTYTPDHPIINYAANQNYEEFYRDEIINRKSLLQPPFCDICVIGINGTDEKETQKCAGKFFEYLKIAGEKHSNIPLKVMEPGKAGIFKLNSKYRYKIIIKCKANKKFKEMLKSVLINALKDRDFSKVSVFADINGDIIV